MRKSLLELMQGNQQATPTVTCDGFKYALFNLVCRSNVLAIERLAIDQTSSHYTVLRVTLSNTVKCNHSNHL